MAMNDGLKGFIAKVALAARRFVKLDAATGTADVAGVADTKVLGVCETAKAIGETANVRMMNMPGTQEVVAATAITAGADIYLAADGKVSALSAVAGDYLRLGYAIEAATADGDIIEAFLNDGRTLTTVAA